MFTRRLLRRLAISAVISVCFLSFFQQLLIDVLSQAVKQIEATQRDDVLRHSPNKLSGHQPIPGKAPPPAGVAVETTTTSTTMTTTAAPRRGFEILGEPADIRLEMVPEQPDPVRKNGRTRVILSTSPEFTQAHLGGCPDWNCRLTSDASQRDSADAVIFKMGGAHPTTNRNPNQYYVYFTQESPMHSGAGEPYRGYYNLTMGYRRDADIPCPYGYTLRRQQPQTLPELTDTYLAGKSKPIAWMVSNCQTPGKRRQYVNELAKHIPVDIFGACGTKSCPKPAQRCNGKLSTEYRFYLAFENSVCTDYITEKLWNQGYQADVVPIVLKDSIVSRFIPPDSYLAADSFVSPQALAAHLRYLMRNDTAYRQLLTSWKRHYDVIFLDGLKHDWRERPWGFCRLCDLLWTDPRPQRIKYDFSAWWRGPDVCDNGLVDRLLRGKS